MNDRQQALLDAARCLPFADHVGDVVSSLALLWMSAGLGEIPEDEASGEIDDDELERMGGRKCHEVPKDRDVQLFEMLDSMVRRWPSQAKFDDCNELAGILGVELWTRVGGDNDPWEMRFRPGPADAGLEGVLGDDTTGWEKCT